MLMSLRSVGPVLRNRLSRVLLVAAMIVATAAPIVVVVRALNQQRSDAVLIDVAGRQRMLAERLAKEAVLEGLKSALPHVVYLVAGSL